jgi:TPR repeat protein
MSGEVEASASLPFQWRERVDSLMQRFSPQLHDDDSDGGGDGTTITRDDVITAIRETAGHAGLAAKLLTALATRRRHNARQPPRQGIHGDRGSGSRRRATSSGSRSPSPVFGQSGVQPPRPPPPPSSYGEYSPSPSLSVAPTSPIAGFGSESLLVRHVAPLPAELLQGGHHSGVVNALPHRLLQGLGQMNLGGGGGGGDGGESLRASAPPIDGGAAARGGGIGVADGSGVVTFAPPPPAAQQRRVRSVTSLPPAPSVGNATDLEAAAGAGDAEAQFQLGACFASGGAGVAREPVQAVRWWARAAAAGHGEALSALGVCYRDGLGTGADSTRAVECFEAAAQLGIASAQRRLGVIWFQTAARGGGATAASAAGDGTAEELDAEAVKWFRAATEQGDAMAQCWLGVCHASGRGVPRHAEAAARLYRLSAEQGYARAQYNLAVCYSEGNGVPKILGEAVRWWHAAAVQDDAQAQCWMGVCHATGWGVSHDERQAVAWFQRSADQGWCEAQCWLAECYADGRGVDMPDRRRAEQLFELAGKQGYVEAQYLLALQLLDGQGDGEAEEASQRQTSAVRWLQCAAAKAHGKAQARLGWCFANGEGTPVDMSLAMEWWREAATQGVEIGLPLASYHLPDAPGYQVDIVLRHTDNHGQVARAATRLREATSHGLPTYVETGVMRQGSMGDM